MNNTMFIHDVRAIQAKDPEESKGENHYFVREIIIRGENGDMITLNLFSDSMKGLIIRKEEI